MKSRQIQKASTVANAVKSMLKDNKGKFFTVTFIKADGTERTINGQIRHVKGHDAENTVAHIEKYLTVVLPERDERGNEQFRNVNCETIIQIKMGGAVISFER